MDSTVPTPQLSFLRKRALESFMIPQHALQRMCRYLLVGAVVVSKTTFCLCSTRFLVSGFLRTFCAFLGSAHIHHYFEKTKTTTTTMGRDETERNGEEQERETLQTGEELRALKLSRWIFKPRALARSVRFPLSCRWWRPGGGDQTNGQATSNGQLLLQVVRASPFVGLGGLQRSCAI